jgi:pyrroline-5-carboxylate reductase
MKIGFLGTGTITSAMVTGLNAANRRDAIRLSPRNAIVAAELAASFPEVTIAASNQQVLDESDVVVIAVRPQIAREVLSELRFRGDHHVISLVSGFPVRRLSELVAPATRITRAVPLPAMAKRRSPTAIFPPDPIAVELFGAVGAAFEVASESEFDALCVATATMASYFAFADTAAAWLARHGIAQLQARDYVTQIFSGLTDTAREAPERDFQTLAREHATKGGTNEQVLASLNQHGVFEHFSDALDAILRRVTATSQ